MQTPVLKYLRSLFISPFLGVECFAIGDDDYVCGSCPPDMTGNGKKCYKSSQGWDENIVEVFYLL